MPRARSILLCTGLAAGLTSCSRESRPASQAPASASPAETSTATSGPGSITLAPLAARPPRAEGAPLFEEVPADRSGLVFTPDFTDFTSDVQLMRLNVGGGICTADFTGDGKCDLYITSPKGGGAMYENLGDWKFRDITELSGLKDPAHWGTGAQGVDVDDDGDIDLFVCGYRTPNRLWINDGKGRFTDRATTWGLATDLAGMTMAWADIDADGKLDGYLATTGYPPGPQHRFRVNMVPQGGRDVPVVPPELEEYWELLYLPGDRARNVPAAKKDRLFRQENGRFTDVTAASGIRGPWFTLSAIWWDFNADDRPDCYVSNDYTGPDRLYQNRGGGAFDEVLATTLPHTPWFSMGADIGDLDNDGLIDLLASDMAATSHYRDKVMMGNMDDSAWFLDWAEPRQFMRNSVYLNTGTGRLVEAAFAIGLAGTDWTWTPRIEDYDNDGWADVFITNGVLRDLMNSDVTQEADRSFKPGSPELGAFWRQQPMRKEKNLAFRNGRDLKFESAAAAWGLDREGVSFGAATADFDNDGALDLAVSNADAPVSLYRNHAAGQAFQVRLIGTTSNSQALGATVTAVTENGLSQSRYVTLTRGFLSASDPLVHFGLGDATTVKQLTVRWPGGREQVFRDLPANHLATVTEGGNQQFSPPAVPAALFSPDSSLAILKHVENPFDDFKREPLLPNKMSTAGPGMAWGDVDGDGDDDVWLGGAAGSPGQIAVRQPGGSFMLAPSPALAADKYSEDTGGLWFDADGDGDLDLYVASGGNEADDGDTLYTDRLYLNDGKGSLAPAAKPALPDDRTSSGVVVGADFDRDGDTDLFVGGRQTPGNYPKPPQSRLLVNQGGTFEARPINAGMVTSGLWTDANGDGWLDLMLTVDWGSPRLWLNTQGTLTDVTEGSGLAPLLGWWNGLAAADFDHDGDVDYALTNFGLNTKYKATPQKPELLFAGDFDDSGRLQLVEAKYEGDVLRPRRGLSCSSTAMPFIKSKLPTFHTFASAALGEVYPPEKLETSLKLSATELQSGVVWNDGAGRFTFTALPRRAQLAPAFGVVASDLNADGHPDIALTHNFFGPQRETGRMNGGLGLLLAGDGKGGFTAVAERVSGIVVPEDARSLALADVNGDNSPDLVFGLNNGPVRVFLRQPNAADFSLRLKDTGGRSAAGARVTITTGTLPPQTAELALGGSYLTGSPQVLWFTRQGAVKASVRWPDGAVTTHEFNEPSALIAR